MQANEHAAVQDYKKNSVAYQKTIKLIGCPETEEDLKAKIQELTQATTFAAMFKSIECFDLSKEFFPKRWVIKTTCKIGSLFADNFLIGIQNTMLLRTELIENAKKNNYKLRNLS